MIYFCRQSFKAAVVEYQQPLLQDVNLCPNVQILKNLDKYQEFVEQAAAQVTFLNYIVIVSQYLHRIIIRHL